MCLRKITERVIASVWFMIIGLKQFLEWLCTIIGLYFMWLYWYFSLS